MSFAGLGALQGIRVLDVTQFLAGPLCTMLLSELGAEVIKVERPGVGDPYRAAGPPFLGEHSVPFISANRNKRSITLELSRSEGRSVLRKLVETADVVVVSHKPSKLAGLGLSYGQLREVKPDVIYCSISGYGQAGPHSEKGALDLVIQAVGGLMSVTGSPDGDPTRTGVPITDYGTGIMAALAVVAAIRSRDLTGRGVALDCSLFSTATLFGSIALLQYQVTGEDQPRSGNYHPHIAPYELAATADGHIVLSAATPSGWKALCSCLEIDGLETDPRFATNEERIRNRAALVAVLDAQFRTAPSARWLELLEAAGVPCGEVHAYGDLLSTREWLAHMPLAPYEEAGRTLMAPVMPVKWDGELAGAGTPAPNLGAHTSELLAEIGLSRDDVEELRMKGAI